MRLVILSSLFIAVLLLADVMWTTAEGAQLPSCNTNISSGGENLPSSTTLSVEVCYSYSYKADDGTTVVLGEVLNHNDFPITNAKVGVLFLDQNDNTIEYKTGTTLLQVAPAQGMAPFSISSTKADPSITKVSVKMAGFNSASPRDQVLNITAGILQISEKVSLSGTIKNGGTSTSSNTHLYLVSYDAFQRVVAIGTIAIPDISKGAAANFTVTSIPNSKAKTFQVIAESDNYQSKPTDVTSILVSLPVLISKTDVTDPEGHQYSSIPVNASVKISSVLKNISSSPSQPYVYYVQVKSFNGKVEFIGKSEGVFLGTSDETTSITWNPNTEGSYYIETYVWNSDTVPLSSAGTRINVVLVK